MTTLQSQFFVFALILLSSPLLIAVQYYKVINEFQENVAVRTDDVIQCEITKTNLEETNNDYHLFSQPCHVDRMCYLYMKVTEKCFSFKVKTLNIPCIAFGNTASVTHGHVEIVLDWGKHSIIRERGPGLGIIRLQRIPTNLVTEAEYRGFWVRWLDDHLFEIGRENELVPFLTHKFARKLEIDYVGIMTWTVKGAWIIDRDPKCPGSAGFGEKVPKKVKTESSCMIV